MPQRASERQMPCHMGAAGVVFRQVAMAELQRSVVGIRHVVQPKRATERPSLPPRAAPAMCSEAHVAYLTAPIPMLFALYTIPDSLTVA